LIFNIRSKHTEVPAAVKSYAEEKTSKLPRYYDGVNQVDVIIDANHGVNKSVEIIARGEHSNVFVVTETGEDLFKCIDMAVHKLEGQLKKKKTKERDDKHAGEVRPS
jgi:putative sigma-54 modulation protein